MSFLTLEENTAKYCLNMWKGTDHVTSQKKKKDFFKDCVSFSTTASYASS